MLRLNAPGAVVGAWLSVVGVGVPGSAVALADADILPPGEALTRELAAGEAHVFEFALEADQLLDAVVEQQGVDVAMTLLEPAGTAALQIDSQENPKRLERVLWIARASGLHSLRVQASPGRPGGGYQILLSLPRAATLGDVGHVSAQREYERGCRLRKEGTPRSHAEARPWLENAIAGFRRAEDPRGEAEAKEHLTEIELAAGRTAEALAIAQDSLAIQRQLHDRAAEATGLQRIGRVYRALGRSTEAMACVLDAVRLARASANDWAEALYLNTVGIFYRRNGDTERAIEAFDVALAKSRASGNRSGEAAAVGNRGIAYYDLGEYRKTLEDYREALSLYEAAGDHWSAALTYNNMGNVHKRLGEYERARELYVHFLTLAHEREPGGVGEARALNSLSSLFIKMGDYSEALSYARRSLEMKVKGGDLRGQATVMKNIGESLHAMGQSEEGLKSLREALRIIRDVGDRHYEAQARLEIARVERDRGNLGEALREAEAAVSLTEELRAAVTNPDLRASFVAAEQDVYAVYIEVLMRLHEREAAAGHDAAALQASERARARVLLDTLIEARADVRQGVDPALLDRERALQKQLSEASELLSRVLVRRETSEAVANARQELAARSEEYRQVQSRIRQESPRYAALTQPVPSTVEEIRRELLDEETVLLEFYLGEERSFLWAVTPAELVSQALPKSAQIEAAARSVHGLLTARQRTRALASTRESDRRLEAESMALSRLLLGRIASRLDTDWKDKRLLIVASGALAYLPFGALPSPVAGAARPLLRDHEIVFAPSASVLIALRREHARAPRTGTSVAVLADPVFEVADPRVHNRAESAKPAAPAPTGLTRAAESLGHGFTRLPFSRGEADAIAALVPRASLLEATDFAANRTLVAEGGLGDRAIVHFATHGLLDSEHPDLSGLVLSLVDEKGTPQDGFLRMHEIYNLRLPADLVVLSACQTALGREIRGEGLVGLTRGFMYAGARGVVASLWQVDDESTAELMKRFYRAMLKEGRRPAAALRNAQLELSRHPRWAPPFYWAGFVLQGDWK